MAKCNKCLSTWTPTALRCVLASCPRSSWETPGAGQSADGKEARRQLELNNEIAALMHKCVRGAKDRGGESESAMVEAGLVSRFQAEEVLNVKVLAQAFVLPWAQGPHVHSWLTIGRASSASGDRGLGVLSGATKMLAMGGHGDTLVSAKDAKCHSSETLEQALKPLMRKQSAINAYRLRRFVNENAPRHHNSYLDLPLRQGGGRAVSYPQSVEITWKHRAQITATEDAAVQRGSSHGQNGKKEGLWDEVWKLS